MSIKDRQLGGTRAILLANVFTLTGTPTTSGVGTPTGTVVANIQGALLSDWISVGEVWRPLGVQVSSTTTITVTPPQFTLKKAPFSGTTQTFVAASSGGIATGTLLVAGGGAYYPFTSYIAANAVAPATNFVADAAGDAWTVTVNVSPTAGAATLQLHYALISVAGISEAITTL